MCLISQRKKNRKGGQLFDPHDLVEIRVKFVRRVPPPRRDGEVHRVHQFSRRPAPFGHVDPEIHVEGCGRGTRFCREKSSDSRRKIGLATVREEAAEGGTKACVVREARENAETPNPRRESPDPTPSRSTCEQPELQD